MEINFFRLEINGGSHYFAASSIDAVLNFPKRPSDGKVLRVTEFEASYTPHYLEFYRNGKDLCSDGTYSLGVLRKSQTDSFKTPSKTLPTLLLFQNP